MDIRVILGQGPRGEHMEREGLVKHIQKDEEWDEAINAAGDDLVMVDWYSQYCAPCRVMAPLFADLSEKYSSVRFFKVNALELMDLAARCGGVNAFPTFQLWHMREKIDEFAGASASALEALLVDHGAEPDAKYMEKKQRERERKIKGEEEEEASQVVNVHTREAFAAAIADAQAESRLAVVLFHASWVPACKNVIRLVKKMSGEQQYIDAGVVFLSVDFEELPEPCDECNVRAIPTFVIFNREGVKVDVFPSVSRARIEKKLREYL